MEFHQFNHLSHIIIGTIAFIGGIVALGTKKGSRFHIIGGRAFVLGMLYTAISTIGFMLVEFLPLAVFMSVATVYLLISALSALRYKKKYSRIIDTAIIIFPILLCVFASIQFIRILPEISLGTFARLLFALTFLIVVIRDIKLIRSRPTDHLFFLKRHAFRMILAFGFAVMAVLRIGIKVDFLGLEFTTFFPLLLSLVAALYVEKHIEKVLPSKN